MRIKAKKGYNIVINDINISLQNGKDYIDVDDELFNSSADAKRVLKFIDIEKVKVKKEKAKTKTIDTTPIHAEKPANGVVMMQNDEKQHNTGAVVFDPNKEADTSSVHTESKLISDKTEVKAETTAKVNIQNGESEQKELKIEATLPDKGDTVKDNSKDVVKDAKGKDINKTEVKDTTKVDKKNNKKNKKDNKEESK